MLHDGNGNPTTLFGKVERPLGLLFTTIPLLVLVGLFNAGRAI